MATAMATATEKMEREADKSTVIATAMVMATENAMQKEDVCSLLFSSSSPKGRKDLSRLFEETTVGLEDPKVKNGSDQWNRVKIP